MDFVPEHHHNDHFRFFSLLVTAPLVADKTIQAIIFNMVDAQTQACNVQICDFLSEENIISQETTPVEIYSNEDFMKAIDACLDAFVCEEDRPNEKDKATIMHNHDDT